MCVHVCVCVCQNNRETRGEHKQARVGSAVSLGQTHFYMRCHVVVLDAFVFMTARVTEPAFSGGQSDYSFVRIRPHMLHILGVYRFSAIAEVVYRYP